MKNSLRIARFALLPAKGEGETVCPCQDGAYVVAPEATAACLADLGRLVDSRGELHLLFPGCFALAAPFLLFRLKREGFSRCRAYMQNSGLVLMARR